MNQYAWPAGYLSCSKCLRPIDPKSEKCRYCGQAKSDHSTSTAVKDSSLSAAQEVEAFWLAVHRSWDIEPREYFEEKAPKNGFESALAMAVHHMWKRETNDEAKEAWQDGYDVALRIYQKADREQLVAAIIEAVGKVFEPAHTYTSENAEAYYHFDNGQRRAIDNAIEAVKSAAAEYGVEVKE